MCEWASQVSANANPAFLFSWVFLGCVKAEADTFSSGCPYGWLWGGTIPDQLGFERNSVPWKSRYRQRPRVERPRDWSHQPWGVVLMQADCLYLLLVLSALLNPQLHESPTRQSPLPKPQRTFVGKKKRKVDEVAAGLDHLLGELDCTRQQWKKVSRGRSYDPAVQRNKLRSSSLSSTGQESACDWPSQEVYLFGEHVFSRSSSHISFHLLLFYSSGVHLLRHFSPNWMLLFQTVPMALSYLLFIVKWHRPASGWEHLLSFCSLD